MKFMNSQYQKDMQTHLRAAAKGSGWKQAKGVVFRQVEDWFIAGQWKSVSADPADGLRIEILAKPMAIDPMLWQVMGSCNNNDQPLSFRYWGFFVCGAPVLDFEVIKTTEPERAAPEVIARLQKMLPKLIDKLGSEKFSDLAQASLGNHDNWRMTETIIHALWLEGDNEGAVRYAEHNRGSMSNSSLIADASKAGKTHNELVIEAIKGHAQTDTPDKGEDRTAQKRGFWQRIFGKSA